MGDPEVQTWGGGGGLITNVPGPHGDPLNQEILGPVCLWDFLFLFF